MVLLTDDDLKDAVAAARAAGKFLLRLSFPKKPSKSRRESLKAVSSSGHFQYAALAAFAVAGVTMVLSRKH